jgi:hypothetical protein
MKRGTSKAVPIVVSAGLAVGVFCGLLFGVGKKSEAVAAAPSKGTNVKPEEDPKPDPHAAPAGLGATAAKPVTPPPTTPPPAAGSAAAKPTVAAAGSAAPTVPADKTTKLSVVIKTEGAAKDAKLMIDGKEVDGLSTEIPTDKKSVKVEVKSNGYRSYEKKLDLTPGELTLEIEMAKKPSSSGAPGVKPPKRPDKPPSGGGGLIDI